MIRKVIRIVAWMKRVIYSENEYYTYLIFGKDITLYLYINDCGIGDAILSIMGYIIKSGI